MRTYQRNSNGRTFDETGLLLFKGKAEDLFQNEDKDTRQQSEECASRLCPLAIRWDWGKWKNLHGVCFLDDHTRWPMGVRGGIFVGNTHGSGQDTGHQVGILPSDGSGGKFHRTIFPTAVLFKNFLLNSGY